MLLGRTCPPAWSRRVAVITVRQPRSARRRRLYLLTGVLLAAFALRVAALGHKSLWLDEADSVYFAAHNWRDVVWGLCDPHPPGYYLLLKAAMVVAGRSEYVVRLTSVFAGVLGVAALARLTRELRALPGPGRRWGDSVRLPEFLPAALLAVSPLHVWYSQEARMYALVVLLTLGAANSAARMMIPRHMDQAGHATGGDRGCATLGYALLSTLALLTDQSAAIPLLCIALACAVAMAARRRWRRLAAWAAVQSVPVGVYLVWYRTAQHAGTFGPITSYPFTMLRLSLARVTSGMWLAALMAGLVVVGAGLASLAVRWVRSGNFGWHRLQARGLQTLAILMLVGYAGGAALAVVPRLYTVKRLAISVLPYGLLLVAWAMGRLLGRRRRRALVLLLPVALSLVNATVIPKAPWRTAIATVSSLVEPGDTVWVDELAVPVYDYYSPASRERTVMTVSILGCLAADPPTGDRLWLITHAGRYRNPFDFLPGLAPVSPATHLAWPGIDVRAYDAATLPSDALRPAIPPWAHAWPSPVDEACSSTP